MRRVLIKWEDAADSEGAWSFLEEVKKFSEERSFVDSVGWIVLENENFVLLCGDTDTNYSGELYGRVRKIPKKMIQQIIDL